MVIIIQVIQTPYIRSESNPFENHLRYVRNNTTVTHEIIKSREIQKCGKQLSILIIDIKNGYLELDVSVVCLSSLYVHGILYVSVKQNTPFAIFSNILFDHVF